MRPQALGCRRLHKTKAAFHTCQQSHLAVCVPLRRLGPQPSIVRAHTSRLPSLATPSCRSCYSIIYPDGSVEPISGYPSLSAGECGLYSVPDVPNM